MYQRTPLLALIAILLLSNNIHMPIKATLKKEKKIIQLILHAKQAIQKAYYTFAKEFITLEKLEQNKDEKDQLIAYQKITKKIKNRYKKHKKNLQWDEFSDTINILLWGSISINNPFCHYCNLINFVLKDLEKRKKNLHFATRTIHQSLPIRQKSMATINEINKIIDKINYLKNFATNYEYEFECHQISKLTTNNIICICILIAGNIKPFILKTKETSLK